MTSIEDINANGIYEVSQHGEQKHIKASSGDVLVLASKKAELLFVDTIRKTEGIEDDVDIESWYGYERNMANPKA